MEMYATGASASRGLLIAAVDGGPLTQVVVRTGVALAKRYAMELRLVSVVDPVPYELVALEVPFYPVYPAERFQIEDRLVRERELELAQILAAIQGEVLATACVVVGGVGFALINEAINKRANFILTAYQPNTDWLMSTGLSTALTLMHDAPLPVLAVSSEQPFDASRDGLKLMLADDLQEPTSEAAAKAFQLASVFPNCQLRHVHVHHDLGSSLIRTWRHLTHQPPEPAAAALTPGDRQAQQPHGVRLQRLAQRGEPYRAQALQAGAQVATDLRSSGRVDAEIHAATVDFAPDLVVFGRHRLLRARPFLLGQMPFKTMLHTGRSILIVPPREALYARLPFPAAYAAAG